MKVSDLIFLMLLTCALFALSNHARADAYDAGMTAYHAERFDEAMAQWRPLAEHGHAQAAYNLGFMHEFGYGVGVSDAEAFRWYLRAAEYGHTMAQRSLTWMYERGKGAPPDRAEATRWLEISTSAANPLEVPIGNAMLDLLKDELHRAGARYEAQQQLQPKFEQELEASNRTS